MFFPMMDYSILHILVTSLIHSLLSIVIINRIDYNFLHRVICKFMVSAPYSCKDVSNLLVVITL